MKNNPAHTGLFLLSGIDFYSFETEPLLLTYDEYKVVLYYLAKGPTLHMSTLLTL